MIRAGIPYTLLYGHEDNDVPTFWLLLYGLIKEGLAPEARTPQTLRLNPKPQTLDPKPETQKP